MEEKVASATVEELRLVVVYQPVWQQCTRTVEEYRHYVENQVSVNGREQVLVI